MSFSKPKAPQPTPEQKALEKEQILQMAKLNEQENERRKRLLTAQQGVRAYSGSPIFRSAPGNTAGPAPSAGAGKSGGSSAAGYAYAPANLISMVRGMMR